MYSILSSITKARVANEWLIFVAPARYVICMYTRYAIHTLSPLIYFAHFVCIYQFLVARVLELHITFFYIWAESHSFLENSSLLTLLYSIHVVRTGQNLIKIFCLTIYVHTLIYHEPNGCVGTKTSLVPCTLVYIKDDAIETSMGQ